MDSRGGCCIARYGAGGAASASASQYDQIMLRFRPIAPKPVASGGAQGGARSENNEEYVKTGRGKRRCAKDTVRKTSRKRKSCSPEHAVVTLPLLPESPDLTKQENKAEKKLLSFSDGQSRSAPTAPPAPPQEMIVGSSYVIVECLIDTLVESDSLGRSDEEKKRSLEEDASPGFISDAWNRVWWTNEAYRRMMKENVVVWLVMKEKVPVTNAAFSCRVRVQRCSSSSSSLTLPCDVWRMESGGLAWRLDVKAALSLGR